ncbi:hypothetical protein L227DRAFT_165874 [Lentinus tigrinus ALCF2SS1-6]|uniref:Uncharacterized protein n=1 Tax=Lentinus tigrinus ALCF2SS1-6 TaxID=1328759 RepID=A0A5C2S7D8_9APHY|nr:hypothetical protein L227DRAFT_165874 [Lentinus tigrinus ALCF2SS1-6]
MRLAPVWDGHRSKDRVSCIVYRDIDRRWVFEDLDHEMCVLIANAHIAETARGGSGKQECSWTLRRSLEVLSEKRAFREGGYESALRGWRRGVGQERLANGICRGRSQDPRRGPVEMQAKTDGARDAAQIEALDREAGSGAGGGWLFWAAVRPAVGATPAVDRSSIAVRVRPMHLGPGLHSIYTDTQACLVGAEDLSL